LIGESTEVSLVKQSLKQIGEKKYSTLYNQYPRVAEIPFDSDRKCMTTVHQFEEKFLVISKGASEVIAKSLASQEKKNWLKENAENLALEGKRVIAYSYKFLDKLPLIISSDNLEHEQILVGLVGIIDPPRPEAKQAIAECKQAGIIPVMITGDHP
jgi:Ca2+-transporting ATPase